MAHNGTRPVRLRLSFSALAQKYLTADGVVTKYRTTADLIGFFYCQPHDH